MGTVPTSSYGLEIKFPKEPFIRIEPNDYSTAYEESKMAMRLANSSRTIKAQSGRFENFSRKRNHSDQYEEVKMGAHSLRQYNRAVIGWKIAGSRLENKAQSPFAGTIITRNVEIGEMLEIFSSLPLMIAALRTIRFKASLGEATVSSSQNRKPP